MTIGQIKVEDHSNEITAIPALLELIDLTGAIVTIDAMGTQSEIVGLIRAKKAEYILALKSNHPTQHSQVKEWFEAAIAKDFEGIRVSIDRLVEKGHHPTEKRVVRAVSLSEFGGLYKQEQWIGLQGIVMVERTRHLPNKVTSFLFKNCTMQVRGQGSGVGSRFANMKSGFEIFKIDNNILYIRPRP